MMWKQGRLAVRKLSVSDEQELLKWMSDPQVLAYYEGRDRPHDLERVRRNFYSKEERITPCLVLFDNEPIGYIQFYTLSQEEAGEYGYGETDLVFGMDQFIGEPVYWNRGIGTELVSRMVQHLCETCGAGKIVMDPECWNKRAIRCYEKSGFRKIRLLPEYELHEGKWRDCWLMEYVCTEK